MVGQYPDRGVTAAFELHTFSSLNKAFVPQYKHGLDAVDHAIVYFDPAVVAHKQLPPLDVDFVRSCFAREDLEVIVSAEDLERRLMEVPQENHVLLLMSSGRFGGANVTPAPRPATSSK